MDKDFINFVKKEPVAYLTVYFRVSVPTITRWRGDPSTIPDYAREIYDLHQRLEDKERLYLAARDDYLTVTTKLRDYFRLIDDLKISSIPD